MLRPERQAIVPTIEEAVVRQDVLPMNLLVVDDEQYIRQLCANVAIQSGMKVDPMIGKLLGIAAIHYPGSGVAECLEAMDARLSIWRTARRMTW
jgi:hypothetical protein